MPQCLPTGIRALFASAVLDISVGGLAYVLCLQRRLDISVSGLPLELVRLKIVAGCRLFRSQSRSSRPGALR